MERKSIAQADEGVGSAVGVLYWAVKQRCRVGCSGRDSVAMAVHNDEPLAGRAGGSHGSALGGYMSD